MSVLSIDSAFYTVGAFDKHPDVINPRGREFPNVIGNYTILFKECQEKIQKILNFNVIFRKSPNLSELWQFFNTSLHFLQTYLVTYAVKRTINGTFLYRKLYED